MSVTFGVQGSLWIETIPSNNDPVLILKSSDWRGRTIEGKMGWTFQVSGGSHAKLKLEKLLGKYVSVSDGKEELGRGLLHATDRLGDWGVVFQVTRVEMLMMED